MEGVILTISSTIVYKGNPCEADVFLLLRICPTVAQSPKSVARTGFSCSFNRSLSFTTSRLLYPVRFLPHPRRHNSTTVFREQISDLGGLLS